ncbi:MAG: aspartate aminotransferase family protein [Thermodesulfobacteriota bacterium]|nr:aspartate aminotransferase family protein [Thermodesulfobacteriota bacterium]
MDYLMNTYARLPVNLVRGKGCLVWDDKGKCYLDMVAGIAVCSLGHCHPAVVKALTTQARELFHCSNLYGIPQQARLARLISENTFDGKVFFCNSGAEANEAAIKLVRRYYNKKSGHEAKIITMEGSFHGRTLATVAATGQTRFKLGFAPMPAGFVTVEFGNINALETAIDDKTAAVMLEPIQGESGIQVPPPGYLKQVRAVCDHHNLLFAVDEIQTGCSRTGKLFAYMYEDANPDIMTMAKAMANGFPVGAVIAKPEVASAFEPGNHASTFGGNPLAMSAGIATLNTMIDEDIPDSSLQKGLYLRQCLGELRKTHPSITEIRGKGLMVAVEFDTDISFMPMEGLAKGIMLNVIKGRILRLVPPLIISTAEIDQAVDIIDTMLKEKGI